MGNASLTFAVDACRGGVRRAVWPPGETLDLNFMFPGTLDPRITFTRAHGGIHRREWFIQMAAVNAPRWDYDPVTNALRGVLIEARTNLLLNSADLSNAVWVPGNLNVALPVVTGNSTTAPDGTTKGARIDLPAVPTGLNASSVGQAFVATAAVYTFSIWLKGSVGGEVTYIYTTQAATTYYRQQCVLTTQWQRFTLVTGTLTAANWLFCVGIMGAQPACPHWRSRSTHGAHNSNSAHSPPATSQRHRRR